MFYHRSGHALTIDCALIHDRVQWQPVRLVSSIIGAAAADDVGYNRARRSSTCTGPAAAATMNCDAIAPPYKRSSDRLVFFSNTN